MNADACVLERERFGRAQKSEAWGDGQPAVCLMDPLSSLSEDPINTQY